MIREINEVRSDLKSGKQMEQTEIAALKLKKRLGLGGDKEVKEAGKPLPALAYVPSQAVAAEPFSEVRSITPATLPPLPSLPAPESRTSEEPAASKDQKENAVLPVAEPNMVVDDSITA